jgi:hypothetical protein
LPEQILAKESSSIIEFLENGALRVVPFLVIGSGSITISDFLIAVLKSSISKGKENLHSSKQEIHTE